MESVGLCLTILDGTEIAPGHTVTITRAEFKAKAGYDPAQKCVVRTCVQCALLPSADNVGAPSFFPCYRGVRLLPCSVVDKGRHVLI